MDKYVFCQFCGKRFDKTLYVEFLSRNECCKDCFSEGSKKHPEMIGVEIVNAIKEANEKDIKRNL